MRWVPYSPGALIKQMPFREKEFWMPRGIEASNLLNCDFGLISEKGKDGLVAQKELMSVSDRV